MENLNWTRLDTHMGFGTAKQSKKRNGFFHIDLSPLSEFQLIYLNFTWKVPELYTRVCIYRHIQIQSSLLYPNLLSNKQKKKSGVS